MTNIKTLKKEVAPYEKSTMKESIWQLINTLGPFFFYGSLLIRAFRFRTGLRSFNRDRGRISDEDLYHLS